MEKEMIKRLAARLVAQGLRRAEGLSGQAFRERRLAELLPAPDQQVLKMAAAAKFQKAARIRQLCGRLAAAHNIGPKRTGRRLAPRPARKENSTAVLTRKVAHA